MNREHIFPYCHLDLLDTYAIVTCNEGAHIAFDEIQEIKAVLQDAYHGQRIGLIANRENQYSVNPLAIKKLFSDECLIAGAIVGNTLMTKLNAEIENDIVDGTAIRFFPSMNLAIKWIRDEVRGDSID